MTLSVKWNKYVEDIIIYITENITFMKAICIVESHHKTSIVKYNNIIGIEVSKFYTNKNDPQKNTHCSDHKDNEYKQYITLLSENSANNIIIDEIITTEIPVSIDDEEELCETIENKLVKLFAKYIDNYLKK